LPSPPLSGRRRGAVEDVIAAEAEELIVAGAPDETVCRAVLPVISCRCAAADDVFDVALDVVVLGGTRGVVAVAGTAGAPSLATLSG
jgi:hypothetical protein